jgi:hypothetical protein
VDDARIQRAGLERQRLLLLATLCETIDDLMTVEGDWVEPSLTKLGRLRAGVIEELEAVR